MTVILGSFINSVNFQLLYLGKGPKIKKRESMVFDHQGEGVTKNKSLFRFEETF